MPRSLPLLPLLLCLCGLLASCRHAEPVDPPVWAPDRSGSVLQPCPVPDDLLNPKESILLCLDESLRPDHTEIALLTPQRVLYLQDGEQREIPWLALTDATVQQRTFSEVFTLHPAEGPPITIEIAEHATAARLRQVLEQQLGGRLPLREIPSVAAE